MTAADGKRGTWQAVLRGGQWPVFVVVVLVVLGLVALGQLQPVPALAALVPVLLAVLLFGRRETEAARRATAGSASTAATVGGFADALPDACIIIDARAVVVHRNAMAAQHFPGVTEGQPLAFSLRAPALLDAVAAARQSGTAQSTELHLGVPTETWHRVAVAPLPAGGPGDEERLVIVLQSLTEQKRLEAMRTDFIANASHELRTPLTSLIGFLDTLLGPAAEDAAARARFLGIMRSQAARMSKLIDDLLSLSRIEMRQHMRPSGTVEAASLLREVAEGLQVQAQEAGLRLELALPEGAAPVTGDRDELYEVFENLIENAIKYGSDGGSVEVVLARLPESAEHAYAVSVTDHGAGIEPEHVPRLTERFYRVDAESSRRKKGTGLGLAIVKHIVTRHRGALSIRSKPGEGTRVDVLLAR